MGFPFFKAFSGRLAAINGCWWCSHKCCQQTASPIMTMVALQHDGDPVVEDAADPKLAQLGDPIVGRAVKTWDDATGEGARSARPLPSPKAPTQAAWNLHRLTHLPYACWCPVCVATEDLIATTGCANRSTGWSRSWWQIMPTGEINARTTVCACSLLEFTGLADTGPVGRRRKVFATSMPLPDWLK